MYLDADRLGHDLGTCDMLFIPVCENKHWHIHVVNFPAGPVEILSSLPLHQRNNINASTRQLSLAISKALDAYKIHMNLEVSRFLHVQPDLVQQQNGYDCGVLALKYMEFWNGATLRQSLDKKHVYRLQLVVTLLLNEGNNVRQNYAGMSIVTEAIPLEVCHFVERLKKLGRFGRSKIQLWHLHDVVMSTAILAVLNRRTKRRHVPAHSGMRIIFGTKTIEILMMNTIQNMSIILKMMMIFLALIKALIVRQV